MKIKLFTHDDLDAVGCEIFIRKYMKDVYATRCDYDEIQSKTSIFLKNKEYENFDLVLFADICPPKNLCVSINSIVKKEKANFHVVDHHKSRKWLKKYDWVSYVTGQCAATSVISFLIHRFGSHREQSTMKQFSHAVNAYDMWLLDNFYRKRGENLNALFKFYGYEKFIEIFSENLEADSNEINKSVLETLNDIRDRYIENIINNQSPRNRVYIDSLGKKYKIFVATQYTAILGHTILEKSEGEELDYVAVINPEKNKCSMYARPGDEEMDVSVLATKFGGDGHYKAAGFYSGYIQKIDKHTYSLLSS